MAGTYIHTYTSSGEADEDLAATGKEHHDEDKGWIDHIAKSLVPRHVIPIGGSKRPPADLRRETRQNETCVVAKTTVNQPPAPYITHNICIDTHGAMDTHSKIQTNLFYIYCNSSFLFIKKFSAKQRNEHFSFENIF